VYDVFICHCSTDKKDIVDPLVAACIDAGIKCWFDSQEIQWGDSIPQRISDGLQKSQFVLVVISENSVNRRWPLKEISAAIAAEVSHGAVRVLPLYVGDRRKLEQLVPLLADKHGLTWNGNPENVVEALRRRLGGKATVSLNSPLVAKTHVPKLRVPITDMDRDRFLRTAFKTICGYFEHAKSDVEASEPRITLDLTQPDTEKLRVKLYLNGRSITECQIWIASLGRHGTINFFAGRPMFNEFNTSNEMISVEESSGEMRLKGMMGSLAGHTIINASAEDAAAVLWKWFVQPLERH